MNLNWTDQANAGDQLVITDFAGKAVFDQKATGANQMFNSGFLGWQNGIVITTLDSGVVNISVGSGK